MIERHCPWQTSIDRIRQTPQALVPNETGNSSSFHDGGNAQGDIFPYSSELPPDITNGEIETRTTPHIPAPPSALIISKRITLDVDVTNPSMSTELLAFEERRAARIHNRKRLLISAGVFVLLATFVGLGVKMLTIARPETPTGGPPSQETAPAIAPPRKPVAPDPIAAPAAISPPLVNIRIQSIPEEATVYFNQHPVSSPIHTLKSDTPQYLEIKLGEQRLFSMTLVPNRDRTITVPKLTGKRGKRKTKTQEPSESSAAPSKKDRPGKLSSNPFPLKQNPFSAGE